MPKYIYKNRNNPEKHMIIENREEINEKHSKNPDKKKGQETTIWL